MKKIILFALLLIVSAASFSQPTTTTTPTVKTDYMKKSKNKKTVAWVCLGGGGGLFLIGIAVYPEGYAISFWDTNTPEQIRQANTSEALILTGITSMLVSIPFFIASHLNKRKSMSLSFKNETAPQLQKSSFVYKSLPSLTLRISL